MPLPTLLSWVSAVLAHRGQQKPAAGSCSGSWPVPARLAGVVSRVGGLAREKEEQEAFLSIHPLCVLCNLDLLCNPTDPGLNSGSAVV